MPAEEQREAKQHQKPAGGAGNRGQPRAQAVHRRQRAAQVPAPGPGTARPDASRSAPPAASDDVRGEHQNAGPYGSTQGSSPMQRPLPTALRPRRHVCGGRAPGGGAPQKAYVDDASQLHPPHHHHEAPSRASSRARPAKRDPAPQPLTRAPPARRPTRQYTLARGRRCGATKRPGHGRQGERFEGANGTTLGERRDGNPEPTASPAPRAPPPV